MWFIAVNTRHGCKGFGRALICAAFALVPLTGSHFAYMVLASRASGAAGRAKKSFHAFALFLAAMHGS